MEDSYNVYGGKKAAEAEDLEEEEVWAVINAIQDSNSSSKTKGNFNERDLSFAWHEQRMSRHHTSAPVEIPKFSKIKNMSKGIPWDGACNSEDEDEDEEVAPPHEVLAKRLARTRIASHSMCEGVGRTLKGRDLSKTRDAILTKTGFIE